MPLFRHGRLRRLAISIALIAGLVPMGYSPAVAAPEKPTLLGFATGDFRQDLPAFTQEAGRPPAFYQLFWGLETDWSAPFIPDILSDLENLGLAPLIEIGTQDLAALNNGGKSANLNAMSTALAVWLGQDPGRHVLISPLPEMNLGEHPWGLNPSGYKAGYRRIRDALLDKGLTPSQIRFVFSPNGIAGDYEAYYPGDQVVDLIGFSKFNRGDPWRDYEATFQRHIDQMRTQISLVKPILITQTASVGSSGRAAWLTEMFTKLKAHDQVIGAVYFNRLKDLDYRVLANGQLDDSFRRGYATWSAPSQASWIFDGRMDAWMRDRQARFGTGFLDVHGHTFEAAIGWLADQGITKGCNPPLNTRFCPDDSVTRGQMAVFISRALNLPSATTDHFTDDQGQFYEDAANQLFESGITQGCGRRIYCGGEAITREQMAAFLARTFDLPPAGTDFFVDDRSSIFQSAINKVARAGITLGCNPPHNDWFCPTDLVTRGQMAAFLRRSLTD